MNSNSSIFSSSVYGTTSGLTAEDIANKITSTQKEYYKQFNDANLKIKNPKVPSLQKIIRNR